MKKLFYLDSIVFLALTLVMLSVGVMASEYPIVGTNHYVQDRGLFNENMVDDTAVAKSLGGSILPPLVADLDNDSRTEIIVLDNNAIVIYQNKTLDFADSIFLNDTSATNPVYTNWIAFDIDGDGMKEIILAQTRTGVLSIIGFNQTTGLYLKNSLSITGLFGITISTSTGDVSQAMVSCQETQKCALIYTGSKSQGHGNAQALRGAFFNTTYIEPNAIDLTGGSIAATSWCLPHIRSYELQDFNNNGLNDIIFNAMRYRSASELVRTVMLRVNATNGVQVVQGTSLDVGNVVPSPSNCDAVVTGTIIQDDLFTPPLTFDARVATPGLETIYGVVVDVDSTPSFELRAFDSTGIELSQSPFPATILGNIPGQLLSNVFRADALAEDNQKDFCVLGGNPVGSPGSGGLSEVNLLCGSMEHTADCVSGTCEHATFDGQVGYNVSGAFGSWNIITHTASHSQASTTSGGDFLENDDLDELVTSYGIFKLTYGTDNVLTNIFAHGKGDSVTYSLDMQNSGLADLLVQTSTNIWYIDDGFTNTGARIASLTTSPCIDSPIRVNTTVSVTFSVQDEQSSDNLENDLVNGRILSYVGETNQQDSNYSLTNSSAGTSFTKFFIANATTASSTLQVFGRDTGAPLDVATVSRLFTVTNDGLVSGSCTETFVIPSEGDDETVFGIPLNPESNNTITQVTAQLHEITGLGATVWWLIIMVIVAAGMLIYGMVEHVNIRIVAGLIMFTEALLVIIGAIIGFIGIGMVILIVLIAIAIIALMLRPMLFGGGQHG